MTRKDYIAIAECIAQRVENYTVLRNYHEKVNEPLQGVHYDNRIDGIERLAYDLSHMLKQDNARFDQDRFLKACGVL